MTKPVSVFLLLFTIVTIGFAQYSSPESIVFDIARNRYLISNAGNGTIISRDTTAAGNVTTFVTGLNSPKGLCIVGDTLFATDVTVVRVIALATGTVAYSYNCPNAIFLNDIDGDNFHLYVSDTQANIVYRIIRPTGLVQSWITTGISSPNGLYLDAVGGRLLLVSFRANSPVQAITVPGGVVSNVVANTGLSSLDGITRDAMGRWYVSSWGTNAVYRYSSTFTMQEMVMSNANGPADIAMDLLDSKLCVPVMNENRIAFMSTVISSAAQPELRAPTGFSMGSAYPNPFNPTTTVTYTLSRNGDVSLKLFDVSGREVSTILKGYRTAGEHRAIIDVRSLTSGTYFIQLQSGGQTQTRKIGLMR